MPLRDKIQTANKLARKIRNLMDLATAENRNLDALAILKKHQSALSKLLIVQRIPKHQHPIINPKDLRSRLERLLQQEVNLTKKKKGKVHFNLSVPEHLVCNLSGEVFQDPVMITTGQTYERAYIEKYIENKKASMQSFIDELEEEFDPTTYFKCPITGKSFDIEKLIPNKRILDACRDFQKKNPWSYEFNPSEDYQKIKVWTNNNN